MALLVDSAREVVKLDPSSIEPPPRVMAEGGRCFVRGVARIGPRLLLLIDFDLVVGEEMADGEERRI